MTNLPCYAQLSDFQIPWNYMLQVNAKKAQTPKLENPTFYHSRKKTRNKLNQNGINNLTNTQSFFNQSFSSEYKLLFPPKQTFLH